MNLVKGPVDSVRVIAGDCRQIFVCMFTEREMQANIPRVSEPDSVVSRDSAGSGGLRETGKAMKHTP